MYSHKVSCHCCQNLILEFGAFLCRLISNKARLIGGQWWIWGNTGPTAHLCQSQTVEQTRPLCQEQTIQLADGDVVIFQTFNC